MASKIKLSFLLFLAMFMCTSEGEFDQPRKTKMSLYFQDFTSGPNATVLQVIPQPNGPLNFSKFGTIFVTDDPITKGVERSSAEVGRVQGMYVTSALDGSNTHVLVSIVFTNEEYKGSTLELQGRSAQFDEVREVAIVGGTGKFRLGRGYVTFETIYYDSKISYSVLRCNVTVFHY